VLLRADGGLKTGWDVIIAALLGAEEYGFGSIAMIAEGCIMARVCHTNNCPVGVATQKEALRKRFTGLPEHVVNFFLFVAEEVRQLMSVLGVARLEDLIGRTELLQPRAVALAKTAALDLSCLIDPIPQAADRSWLQHDAAAHGNGVILEDQLLADAELMAAIEGHGRLARTLAIVNTDRSVGARLAGEIAARSLTFVPERPWIELVHQMVNPFTSAADSSTLLPVELFRIRYRGLTWQQVETLLADALRSLPLLTEHKGRRDVFTLTLSGHA
jgi:glutamate synthase (ferredoxin)